MELYQQAYLKGLGLETLYRLKEAVEMLKSNNINYSKWDEVEELRKLEGALGNAIREITRVPEPQGNWKVKVRRGTNIEGASIFAPMIEHPVYGWVYIRQYHEHISCPPLTTKLGETAVYSSEGAAMNYGQKAAYEWKVKWDKHPLEWEDVEE